MIARHINGESNRRIAAAEGIDRETVGKILSQKEILLMKAQSQAQLFGMVPEAIGTFAGVFGSDDLRLKMATAMKLLDVLRVFPSPDQQKSQEEEREQQKLVNLGRMFEMMLYKSEHYGIELPPDLASVEPEARKLIAEAEADEAQS